MGITSDRWRGIHILTNRVAGIDDEFRVSFSWGLKTQLAPNDVSPCIPSFPMVVVRAEGKGVVVAYCGPERPLPGFHRLDFQEKALEVVRERAAADNARAILQA